MGAGFILRPFFMRKIALGLENMAEGFRILFGYKIQIIFSVFFVSVLILPRRFYFFTKTMLGWIFFKLHWGGVSKTKCLGGGSKSSIGYRAPFESKKRRRRYKNRIHG